MNKAVRWLWQASGKQKGFILLLALIQGLAGTIGVFYALSFRTVVDSTVGKDLLSFRRGVLILAGIILTDLGISAFIRWFSEYVRIGLENRFKKELLDTILRKEYASVSAVHTAEWLHRLTDDTRIAASEAAGILPGLAETMVRLISALVMIIAVDRWFALLLIPGGILLVIFSYLFRGRLLTLHKSIQESDGRLRVYLQEHISGLMLIRAFGAGEQTKSGAEAAMEEHKGAIMRRNRFSNMANSGFGLAMEGMYFLGLLYCARGLLTDSITFGTMAAVLQLISQVQGPVSGISGYLPRWYTMAASAERLMAAEAFGDEEPAAPTREMRRYYTEQFGVLGFRHASFAYPVPGGRENEAESSVIPSSGQRAGTPGRPVLSDLSLEIRKGEIVAFTGPSGCGKSTVLKLMLCLYPLDGGERYLDDRPLTAADRRLFSYVPQDCMLIKGTIREIVSFAEPEAAYDAERLSSALRAACADGFVTDVDADLGERGAGLSVGQMQRLAVARAVFAGSPVLLLDEATSALDEATERQMLENLRNLTDRTVVIVTHRPAVWAACDRVIRFTENGPEEM